MQFPQYNVIMKSPYPTEMANSLICKHFEESSEIVVTHNSLSLDKLSFEIKQDNYMLRNSFLPTGYITFSENEGTTFIGVHFRLRLGVKIIMIVYIMVALLLEIAFIAMGLVDQLSTFVPVVIPICLIIFLYCISFVGLRVPAKILVNQFRDKGIILLSPGTRGRFCCPLKKK